MYVQVSEQENRVAEAKINGLGIRVTCLFYLSGAFPKNTHVGIIVWAPTANSGMKAGCSMPKLVQALHISGLLYDQNN